MPISIVSRTFDPSGWEARCRLPPYAHQREGVLRLLKYPFFMIADEMGAGKTKQTIDAAQLLFSAGEIDRVLVVAPASVRGVWYDPELGELRKHLWADMPSRVREFHARPRAWMHATPPGVAAYVPPAPVPFLDWAVTNYEFIRAKARLDQILPFCTRKTLLVLDESSAVKGHASQQTKACYALRERCGRVVLLNGTPIANNPLDMYSQGRVMHPSILECKTFYHFRARYARMGGFMGKAVVGWQNLEDLQRRFAPYVIRRLKKDCIDLPAKLPTVAVPVRLEEPTWAAYKEMRDEMIVWLTSATASVALQAPVKTMRLSQITSGFAGGLVREGPLTEGDLPSEDWMAATREVREVGREKLDAFLAWLDRALGEDPNLKVLAWCRFRPECERLAAELRKRGGLEVGEIRGGQSPAEREAAVRLLDPRTMPAGPVVVVGITDAGSFGLNLTGSHTVCYLSNSYRPLTRNQSEDRVHRPGQTEPVSYFDFVAEGPQGQRTVDHVIMKALRDKNDVATWTSSAWVRALTEE